MRYEEQSFTLPASDLGNRKNAHGQTWEDIFKPSPTPPKNMKRCKLGSGEMCVPVSVPEVKAPEPVCAEMGCYWDQLTGDSNLWKIHVPPCPRAALDYLDQA